MNDFINKAIDRLCLFLFLILVSFPIFQIISRYIDIFSIPASQEIVQHMTLWIGFVGAVIAARSNKLLSVVREPVFRSSNSNTLPHFFVHAFSVAISEAKKFSKNTIVVVNSCGDAYKDRKILKKRLGMLL